MKFEAESGEAEEKLARTFVAIVILAAAGVMLQTAECYWLWAHGGETDTACDALKLCSSATSLWLVVFLFIYYRRKFDQLKLTNALLPQDTLVSSGMLLSVRDWSFLTDAMVCIVHAPPFFSAEVVVPYYDVHRGGTFTTRLNTDELAALFMMFSRALLLVRWTPYLAGLAGRSTRMYANLNHLNLTTSLTLRMTLLRAPVRLLGTTTVLLLLMLGFGLQLSERRVNHDLDNYYNCLWLAVVSMTGIGFGDFYPQTPLGRVVSSTAFLWGAALAAMLVLLMMRMTELSESESRVKNMIDQTRGRAQIKQRASFYIQAAWAAYLERLQRTQSTLAGTSLLGRESLHVDAKFCRAMRHFRALRKNMAKPDDVAHLIFKEVLDTRSRVELRLRDVEDKLEEMDTKFEHNISAMNELLQKNLKYLKHLAV